MFCHMHNFVTGHPTRQRIVLSRHLQHSIPMLVSAVGYHPRPRHIQQISNIQVCTYLTKMNVFAMSLAQDSSSADSDGIEVLWLLWLWLWLWFLVNTKAVSLVKRLQFFNKVVLVACLAAGHRKFCKTDLERMYVFFLSPHVFPAKGLVSGRLLYWAASRQCHFHTGGSGCAWRAGPNPSLSSLGAGWETAGGRGWGRRFWQKLADGGGVVSVLLDVHFRRLLRSVVGAHQPNKLAKPMARNFPWPECWGGKICAGDWNLDSDIGNCAVIGYIMPAEDVPMSDRGVVPKSDKVSEKGRQVYKIVFSSGYGDHLQQQTIAATQALTDFHVRTCRTLCCFATSIDMRAQLSPNVPCGMRDQQWGQWYDLAEDPALWMQLSDDFVKFCSTCWRFGLALPAPQGGLPSDRQAQSQSQSGVRDRLVRILTILAGDAGPNLKDETILRVLGCCASFVNMTVLSTFNRKTTSAFTNLSNLCDSRICKYQNVIQQSALPRKTWMSCSPIRLPRRKRELVPWLVVIKLMLESFHVATPEYFAQQRPGESARLGPLVPPCIGTCLAPPLGPDVGHCGQHCP